MNGIEFYKYIKNFPIEGVYSTVECLLAEERVPFSKLCKKIDEEDEDRINYIVDNLELL